MNITTRRLYYALSFALTAVLSVFLYHAYEMYGGLFWKITARSSASPYDMLKLFIVPVLTFIFINEAIFRRSEYERQTALLLALTLPLAGIYSVLPQSFATPIGACALAFFFFVSYIISGKVYVRSAFSAAVTPLALIALLTLLIAFGIAPPDTYFFNGVI